MGAAGIEPAPARVGNGDSGGETRRRHTPNAGTARQRLPMPGDAARSACPLGQHDLEIRFEANGQVVSRARSRGVWLLPASASAAPAPPRHDEALEDGLIRLVNGFQHYAAVWYRDLTSGRSASVSPNAKYPAASTVKLGVLLAALNRLGASAEHSAFGYDLQQMLAWSSNLATNRLLLLLGRGSTERGARVTQTALRRAGATSSTFTGEYRAGTAAAQPPGAPPTVSARVTTARDLATLLVQIHESATGQRTAMRRTSLTEKEARLALGYLLDANPSGDNRGLLRPFVPGTVAMARKEGWLRDARHTAAITYRSGGPVVLVVLTYGQALSLQQAQRLGQSLVRATRLG